MQKDSQSILPGHASAHSESNNSVSILLSLYNGAKYLAEQLASLETQTHTNWVLYWRDDGSTDSSLSFMKAFSQKVGEDRCVLISDQNGQHIGVTASYTKLLAAVPSGTAVAFCDQDDVWFPDKLERGLNALAPFTAQPSLYCARQMLTDKSLSPLGLSPSLPDQTSFLAALTQNIATGCTLLLSPAGAELLKKALPAPQHILHDWWAYLMVTGAGGVIHLDNEPCLFYRQHGQNAVGAHVQFAKRAFAALKRGPRLFMSIFRANTMYLMQRKQMLTPDNQKNLIFIANGLRRGVGGVQARFSILRQLQQLRRHEKLEQLVFQVWFLFG
ncbi:glycosyltransferase [Acetobacter indonesiensis NRIC 0313]|uniref:Glycosyl transferase n=1 Tax=Acetobacter indonesiensis TaxID=104101 RepID=A0A6N3T642_9PROT|nr:glycosyltransferase family 2 protein [Acetobacter indonesiensis]GAN64171.1 glycosyl transferase [Acetobacter indonesiensis]GBQ53212.1 glycosyltransferase [Acetobacter indonesiensis NRIC 0313]GEN03047.1 glycosyl transferase family 2 [Acetobacter indonesiensis]